MSHTLRKINLGNTALVDVTIVNYAAGGESFTLAELGLSGAITTLFFFEEKGLSLLDHATFSARYVPKFSGGKLLLLNPDTGAELPTTTALNYTVLALIRGT